MVIFQTPGGSPGYNQFESLDEAISFVEQLRNERDVSNARIFALEEVKFEYKPYFRVELQALTAGAPTRERAQAPAAAAPAAAASTAPTAAPLSPSPTAAPAAPVEPEPVGAGAQAGSLSAMAAANSEAPVPGAGAFDAPGADMLSSEAPTPAAAPAPPAEQPAGSSPARRGLFGR